MQPLLSHLGERTFVRFGRRSTTPMRAHAGSNHWRATVPLLRSTTARLALFWLATCTLCACSQADPIPGASAGDPCEAEYREECGQPCSDDRDCDPGLHCVAGACSAQCSPTIECESGYLCDGRGLCTPDVGDGSPVAVDDPGATPTSGNGSGDDQCVNVVVQFEEEIPTVMLLIDRSGSMDREFPGAVGRWEAVKEALIDPNDGVVSQLEHKVRFGLLLYTSDDGGGPDTCPMLIGDDVPIALNNYRAIRDFYAPAVYFTNGDTPTGEAVVAAREALLAYQDAGPKVIVLATDGEPDTCEDAGAHNEATNQLAVEIVEDTHAAGIDLAVIAVGNDVGQAHLQDLATAGAGSTSATPYQPADRQQLVDSFASIIQGVRSCVVDLDHEVPEEDVALGAVSLDGTSLSLGDDNGWQLNSPTQIELLGSACEQLKADAAQLSIVFPCDVLTPI